MPEIIRTRDCVAHFKGDAYPVAISDVLITNGWRGCQGVMWTDSPEDEFMVTLSDGMFGGFLLWGSDEVPDMFTGMSGNQVREGYGILCTGGWLLSTPVFEQFTYASRVGGPPLVPLVYTAGERLLFSLRGRWTNEDEWTLSGDPRAPNDNFAGSVCQPPRTLNNNCLVLTTVL